MACNKLFCSCCGGQHADVPALSFSLAIERREREAEERRARQEAYAQGVRDGIKLGTVLGYVAGYSDAVLGIPPPPALKPLIVDRILTEVTKPQPLYTVRRLFKPLSGRCPDCGWYGAPPCHCL